MKSRKDLYGAKTCPADSLLTKFNASLVEGLFQGTSSDADPANNGWPFHQVCEEVRRLGQDDDILVHVGDYTYSHTACPYPFPSTVPDGESRVFSDCSGVGSAWGDNSAGWIREFFSPAARLLKRLPWIVLRGNHETCERSGHGWFRYLDPRPTVLFNGGGDPDAPFCVTYTDSYKIQFDQDNWLVLRCKGHGLILLFPKL